MLNVCQSIRRVGIGHQLDSREFPANGLQNFHVPAPSDFYLDALVTRRNLSADLLQQLFGGILDTNGHATRNLLQRSTQQLRKGNALALGLNVPKSVFQRRPGHVVPTHRPKTFGKVGRRVPRFFQGPGNQEIAQNMPGRTRRFITVERHLAAGNFSPPIQAICKGADQDNPAIGRPSETGLEKVDQRHPNFKQFDSFNFHMRSSR